MRRNFLASAAALLFISIAPLPALAGGLPEVCGDIGPDVIALLNRYAYTDAANFCIRAMTLAQTRCYRQQGEVIHEANVIAQRYRLPPVVPGCQPPVLLSAVPPAPVYQPVTLSQGVREAVSHASLFAGAWWLLGLLPLGGLAFIPGGHTSTTAVATNIDDEFNAQYTLAVIGAKPTGDPTSFYHKGFTGTGITVATIDTGVDVTHSEFQGRISPDGGFDFSTGGTALAHGTEVAGIIAANRDFHGMHGVAYGAQIMPLRVFNSDGSRIATPPDSNGDVQDATFAPAIQYAVAHGAQIINGSYGPDDNWLSLAHTFNYQLIQNADLQDGAAYVAAAQAGKILVFPAGDQFQKASDVGANPTGPGFLPFITPAHQNISGVQNGAYRNLDGSVVTADFSAMQPLTIVVVGTNRNGVISSFSNRCGVAAAWCIAAPDENIFTTAPNNQYTTVTGTSFAAPQVSGAAAILKQEFPNLTSAQIVQLLLTTATDLGATGVDSVYGHGLLNLGKAAAPQGTGGIALTSSVTGQRASLQDTSLTFGTAFGLVAPEVLGNKQIAFLDSYDRSYQTSLSNLVHVGTDNFRADNALFSYDRPDARTELQIGERMTLAFSSDSSSASQSNLIGSKPTDPHDNNVNVSAFVVTDSLSKDTKASVHYKDPDALALGFSESDRSRMDRDIVKRNLQNPYAAFAANNGYASIIDTDALGGTVRVAGFFGQEGDGTITDARNFGSQAELSYDLGKGSKVGFLFGALFENNSVLGTVGTGAFSFGSGTMTMYSGFGGTYQLDGKTDLRAAGYVGWTKPSLSNDSLITGMSNLLTTAFNLDIERHEIARKGDVFSFGVSQPIRAENGSMQFNLPYARDPSANTVYSTNLTQDFGKQGREIDVEANYSFPIAEATSFSAGALFRQDAGNEAGRHDVLGVLRVTKTF